MKISQCVKTLLAILWNIIMFLCPTIALYNSDFGKKASFSKFKHIYNYFSSILYTLKEFINKKILKQNNKNTAKIIAVSKSINNNKNSVSNRLSSNNLLTNKALKSYNLLYSKRLKDAPATQNLISNSKQHFIPPGAMVVVYQSLLLQLDLSYIKACSHDLKKVMTVTKDKCAYFSPFALHNYHCLYIF